MDSEYYKGSYKYSSHEGSNDQNSKRDDLNPEGPHHNIFRFSGKCDFDDFDKYNLKEHGWKVAHSLTSKQKESLKAFPGYKDHKETVNYSGPQGFAIMHRNYLTDIHKLIIHPIKLKNSEDNIKSIKSMFELGLGCICYDEDNLPEGLAKKIKKAKESKLIKKLESN
jgi:hypothetical protein